MNGGKKIHESSKFSKFNAFLSGVEVRFVFSNVKCFEQLLVDGVVIFSG